MIPCLPLKTNGICCLCCKFTAEKTDNNESSDAPFYSLDTIVEYLNLDLGKVIRVGASNYEKVEVKSHLCNHCLTIVQEHSELWSQWKALTHRFRSNLKILRDVVLESEKDKQRKAQLNDIMKSSVRSEKFFPIVDTMRKDVIEKCNTKLQDLTVVNEGESGEPLSANAATVIGKERETFFELVRSGIVPQLETPPPENLPEDSTCSSTCHQQTEPNADHAGLHNSIPVNERVSTRIPPGSVLNNHAVSQQMNNYSSEAECVTSGPQNPILRLQFSSNSDIAIERVDDLQRHVPAVPGPSCQLPKQRIHKTHKRKSEKTDSFIASLLAPPPKIPATPETSNLQNASIPRSSNLQCQNGAEPTFFYCSICPAKYKYPGGLARHMSQKHIPVEQKVICDICNRAYLNQRGLAAHKSRVHSVKEIQCPKCQKLFGKESNMLVHLRKYCPNRDI